MNDKKKNFYRELNKAVRKSERMAFTTNNCLSEILHCERHKFVTDAKETIDKMGTKSEKSIEYVCLCTIEIGKKPILI